MNNIYKVIWSKAKNCYVVASEIARSHTKSASGSEKIGGVARHALLASLMALSLLCGGLGVASAEVDVKVAVSSAPDAVEVYTKTGVDTLLDGKADKTALDGKADKGDVDTNKAAIQTLETGKANTSLDNLTDAGKAVIKTMMTDDLAKKADATNVYTKDEVNTAVANVETKLANKADKANTLTGYGITDAYTRDATDTAITTKVNEEKNARELKDAELSGRIDTLSNTVDSKVSKADLNTTLGNYYTQAQTNAAIKTAVDDEKNARDTAIKGEAIERNQAIQNAIGREETNRDAAITKAKKELQEKVTEEETARKEEDAKLEGKITENTTAINNEKAAREAADADLFKCIGTVDADGEYIKKSGTNNVSENLKALDNQAKKNADAIAAEATERTNKDTELEGKITKNSEDITTLQGDVTAAQGDIAGLKAKDMELEGKIKNNADNIQVNKDAIAATDKRTGGITRNDAATETKIEGHVTVDNLGNVKAKGNVTADGKLTGKGVDAGDGAITTTGAVNAGSLTVENASHLKGDVTMDNKLSVTGDTSLKKTDVNGALTVTGESSLKNTTVGGTLDVNGATTLKGTLTAEKDATFEKNVTVQNDLTVDGKLNVGEISMKNGELKNGKKHDSATTITADEISNLAKVTEQGNTTESQFTHNEKGTFNYAKDEKSTDEWKRATSNVTADSVSNEMTDSDGNTHTYYQTATETKEQLVNGNKSNFEKKTAKGNTISITEKDAAGNPISSLTNKQTVDGEKTSVTNKDSSSTIKQGADQIRYNVTSKDENTTSSSIEVKAEGITNTSKDGTITNDAKDIVNNATGNMTNTVGGKLTTTVNGAAEETYKSGLKTDITGDETHTVTGKQINTITNGQENNISGGQKNNILTGNQETTVSNGSIINKAENGDISNTAKNVTNEGTESVTNKVRNNEVKVSKDGVDITAEAGKKITESVGAVTSRTMTDGNIIDKAGDMTVTTDKTTGTTFRNGTLNDTTVINGGTIGTNKVNANETNTKKLTAGAAAGADGGRLTVDARDGVQGSYKSGDYISRSYILANTLNSGVDNGKKPTEDGFVGSRTDHYMDGNKAKLDETVKDADGSNVTNKTSTGTVTTITDGTTTTKTEQGVKDITNTATGGTIKNDAKDIVNNASASITETVGGNNKTEKTADSTKSTIKKGDITTKVNQEGDKIESSIIKDDYSQSNVTTSTVEATANAVTGKDANGNAQTSTVINNKDGLLITNTDNQTSFTTEDGTPTDSAQSWTNIKGNEISTGKVEANYVKMDYADVMRDLGVRGNATVDKDMMVKGNTTLGEAGKDTTLTVNSKATFKEIATFENGAEVKNGLTVSSGGLNVTGESMFNDKVTMNNGLDVTGGVASDSFTVKGTDIKIDSSGINAGGTVISNVADGSISEGSKDAVNGGQLYQVKNDLEGKVNKVGANAAAMANLHPMEFDPDSKWNIAAAMGNYGSETATAIGAFYRPNEDVMVNFSTAFGTGENMVGGGVSVRLGKGGNKLSREESNALKDQVNDLTARMDALLSVLNPNMSKDFPDVPENHWAYEAVSRLAGNDIVQGYPDGEFHGDRTMTRYEMAEIIYNALSRGAEAERELVEEFKPELQAMAASEKATAERAEG